MWFQQILPYFFRLVAGSRRCPDTAEHLSVSLIFVIVFEEMGKQNGAELTGIKY